MNCDSGNAGMWNAVINVGQDKECAFGYEIEMLK